MDLDRGAVMGSAGDGDLELSRQVAELGVETRPLADDLAVDPRVLDLVRCDTRVFVGRGVADAIAVALDPVHLDRSELSQDLGHVFEPDPVELHVLACGPVPVILVVGAGNMGQRAYLLAREHTVGHVDAQHVGVQLEIETVFQAQREELLFGEFSGETPIDLPSKLLGALVD